MRKTLFTFFLSLFALIVQAQEISPVFSTAGNEVWYFIQFKNGSAVLQDKGNATKLMTATKGTTDDQLWKLVGTRNSFEIVSKTGRKIYFSGDRFYTGTTSYKFKLKLNSTTKDAPYTSYYELRPAAGNETRGMNQFGGAGVGRELGLYNDGAAGNVLSFVYSAGKPNAPVFSTVEKTQYYYVNFRRGDFAWAEQGEGNKVLSAAVDQVDEQQWKLTGNQSSFTMTDKLGRNLYFDATDNRYHASASHEATPLMLVESNNANIQPCWEIHRVAAGATGNGINIFGGGAAGNELGEFNFGDIGNAISFNTFDDYSFVNYDYKIIGAANYVPANKATLWYTQPAKAKGVANPWMEYALPIGNGRFGAMVFGDIMEEEVQFNDKTLWSGSSSAYGIYQNFGNLFITTTDSVFGFGATKAVKDYVRQLDLTNATASVSYKSTDGSVTYTREYISSNPDNVIAIRLKASQAGKINVKVSLKGGPENNPTTTYTADGATFGGKLTTVTYNAKMKLVPTSGTMIQEADGIRIKEADELLILLAGGTDFDPLEKTYVKNTAALASTISARVDAAAQKGWDALYSTHVADYKSLFDRASVELDGMENTINTEDLVKYYNTKTVAQSDAHTRMLEMLYFNLGRYMVISASRGIETPSNLQGIWANTNSSPWHSDIHSNINVEENYWPTEPTNLSECHLPFLKYINYMAEKQPQWQNYARNTQYSKQTVGWTLFTENNIFGGKSNFALNYVIANAWYCTHLWQHYRYTLDEDYLKNIGFPPMLSCTKYWMERLVKGTDGTWECPNEYSPEHGPASSNATAHSQQLVWDLFTNTLKGIEVLGLQAAGVDQAFVDQLKDKLAKLDTGLHTETLTKGDHNGIKNGATMLKEWKYYDSNTAQGADLFGHRHQSHLMCLFPLNQINKSSQYFQPAVTSLTLRGDNSTGWSMGWRVNLWARALDGDHAHRIYHNALKHSTSYGTDQGAGGVYYNLFDSHAPFQIDGNFASCAAVAEMLLQSYSDTIQLLPAVPSAWPSGKAKGLKAVGNFTVTQTWKDGKLTVADITSNGGVPCVLNYTNLRAAKVYKDGKPVDVKVISDDVISFPTAVGATYNIDVTGIGTGVQKDFFAESDLQIETAGRKVTVKGAPVKGIKVVDFEGRLLLNTSATSFTLSQSAGKHCIIKVTATSGKTLTQKIALQ